MLRRALFFLLNTLKMKIKLNLSKHCIQTEAKRLYNQSVSQYFQAAGESRQLEEKIEILKEVLEKCDFPGLRSIYPELAGNYAGKASLTIDSQKRIVILINGREICPF